MSYSDFIFFDSSFWYTNKKAFAKHKLPDGRLKSGQQCIGENTQMKGLLQSTSTFRLLEQMQIRSINKDENLQ